uniref:C-type lectin domain-containing protein n=1 Tax=Sparus aurata TaxID=8175 RepID=A0A671XN92_SPAAU
MKYLQQGYTIILYSCFCYFVHARCTEPLLCLLCLFAYSPLCSCMLVVSAAPTLQYLHVVLGQCLFLVCPLHVYHFIKEPKTWKEAQRYCRENYTDLATVYDMNDTQRLSDSVNTGEAWIGLHNDVGQDNRVWHWSLPGVEVTKYFWADNQPNDKNGIENCVVIKNNKWYDTACSDKRAFICYDGENM